MTRAGNGNGMVQRPVWYSHNQSDGTISSAALQQQGGILYSAECGHYEQ